MKTLFGSFWKRNLGAAKLAILEQLEYRFNLFTDAIVQPVLGGAIEVALWTAIFAGSGQTTIGSYPREYYLAYALWAAFFARISVSWMYEFRMIDEVDTGSINTILARPISFYEYYLSQFLGYKLLTSVLSLIVPFVLTFFFSGPTMHERLPLAFALSLFYLVLVHTISFMVTTSAFFFNRVYSFTMAKNIALTMMTGELFPLDLAPEPFHRLLLNLPFASAVFVPVGFITGRLQTQDVYHAFGVIAVSLVVLCPCASLFWTAGRKRYSGTGA